MKDDKRSLPRFKSDLMAELRRDYGLDIYERRYASGVTGLVAYSDGRQSKNFFVEYYYTLYELGTPFEDIVSSIATECKKGGLNDSV